MKRNLFVTACLAVFAFGLPALSGCQRAALASTEDGRKFAVYQFLMGGNGGERMQVITDRDTGCQYLQREGGLTPRLQPNGLPMCGLQ